MGKPRLKIKSFRRISPIFFDDTSCQNEHSRSTGTVAVFLDPLQSGRRSQAIVQPAQLGVPEHQLKSARFIASTSGDDTAGGCPDNCQEEKVKTSQRVNRRHQFFIHQPDKILGGDGAPQSSFRQ